MSLQLPAILSPPTSCIPALALTVSCRRSGCRSRLAPSRVGFRFWASPFPSRLANASGRIVFNMVLFMDWQFASGCSPPRLSTTQLPSTTDSQCSVRWGLSPHCWCALSGALGRVRPGPPKLSLCWTAQSRPRILAGSAQRFPFVGRELLSLQKKWQQDLVILTAHRHRRRSAWQFYRGSRSCPSAPLALVVSREPQVGRALEV